MNKAVGKNGPCSCERAPYGLAANTRARTDGRSIHIRFFFNLKESYSENAKEGGLVECSWLRLILHLRSRYKFETRPCF